MTYLDELEGGLRNLVMQEAEAESALEQARDARKRQEGAVLWEQQRLKREAARAQAEAAVAAGDEEVIDAQVH